MPHTTYQVGIFQFLHFGFELTSDMWTVQRSRVHLLRSNAHAERPVRGIIRLLQTIIRRSLEAPPFLHYSVCGNCEFVPTSLDLPLLMRATNQKKVAIRAVPYRHDFYQRIAQGGSTEKLDIELAKWLAGLDVIVKRISAFVDEGNYGKV